MNEEIRRKYETLIDENKVEISIYYSILTVHFLHFYKSMSGENGVLKGRVNELLEVCREWEFKYDKKMTEISHR
jgi:hypothetical protein